MTRRDPKPPCDHDFRKGKAGAKYCLKCGSVQTRIVDVGKGSGSIVDPVPIHRRPIEVQDVPTPAAELPATLNGHGRRRDDGGDEPEAA